MSNKSWGSRINAQPMFDVFSKANSRELEGFYVARMEIGDTPGFLNKEIHNLISKYAAEPYRYSPSKGENKLIETVFKTQWPDLDDGLNSISIAPANFLITAALAAVTSPDDLVLIPDPGFPTYKLSCDFLGLKIAYYPIFPNPNKEFPDLDSFCKENRLKPKVVIINNPSNPLGLAFDGLKTIKAINGLQASECKFIIDETYANLIYDGMDSNLKNLKATRIRSFSKEHCAPGLRIGYAVAENATSKIISDFISLTISCSPKFLQLAVAEYLDSTASSIFTNSVKEEMNKRFSLLREIIPSEMMLTVPNSAFYSLINTGDGLKSFDFLLERNVATCPGSKFGFTSSGTVRVSLAGASNKFVEDLNMLGKGLLEWEEFVSGNSRL